jgi:hypothetical protein
MSASVAPGSRWHPLLAAILRNSRLFLTRRTFSGSFFLIGGWERLRSFNETASYKSNSAVDSPGAAMSAFEECTEMSARGEEAPLNSGVECAGL